MHGGFRKGAGRKQGFAAKSAEEARKYLSSRVAEEIGPLADKLIQKAKSGDVRAVHLLFDRAWGKPRQEIQITEKAPEQTPEQKERLRGIADVMNELLKVNLREGGSMRDLAKEFAEWHRSRPTIPLT